MLTPRQMLTVAGAAGVIGLSPLLAGDLLAPPPEDEFISVDCPVPVEFTEGTLGAQDASGASLPVLMVYRTISLERSELAPGRTIWFDLPGVARFIPRLDAEGNCYLDDFTLWSEPPVTTTCPLAVPEGYDAETAHVIFDDAPERLVPLLMPQRGDTVNGGSGRRLYFDGAALHIDGAPSGSGRVVFTSKEPFLTTPFRWSAGRCTAPLY